jgi:outer membrane receptor for ferrienterochelin and colicins
MHKKMKNCKLFLSLSLLLVSMLNYSQQKPNVPKFRVSGNIVEKTTNQPLEYATVTLVNSKNPKDVTGGITDSKGNFVIDTKGGVYNITLEFISFKPLLISNKKIATDINLGNFSLSEDVTQLDEIIIRAEKTTVEIKLDKKVYNVGNDLMVKGGTVSDILDNIPSVTVDVDGTIALRGNTSVRILIDGKPSNAISITDALRTIPADAIDKVEVITNPSARYDAEGGGGILNIILKKGKNNGLNGVFIANVADPESYGLSGNVNYKAKDFNIFTTQAYNYRNSPGKSLTNSRYLNADNSTKRFVDERRNNDRLGNNYNANFGIELIIDDYSSWTNSFNYRKNKGDNTDNVFQDNFTADRVFDYTRNRIQNENNQSENIEYNTNYTKKFKKDGHKLNLDGSFSANSDNETALITDTNTQDNNILIDQTFNKQKQNRNVLIADYVLPIKENTQFEAGYRGDFSKLVTDYRVDQSGTTNLFAPNTLEYKENVNALYSQLGSKFNKLSVLLGVRWENSNININLLQTNDFNTKKYNNFFPSAFFTYELTDKNSASLSYSRRIQRPRGRFINPFNGLSSNTNIFVGNPDLDPAFTDAIDLGYLHRFKQVTLSTSLYVNKTDNTFQFIRRENGEIVNGVAVIESTPINLSTENRLGFEFTLNYTPYKWWRLNSNFNLYRVQSLGDYSYVNSNNQTINQNFDNTATTWFTRLSSKINLPYKIDWQTNLNYNGGQRTAQGRSLGVFSANLAFSKDVLKEKGTFSLNVSDVFNSRKRINENFLQGVVDSYSEQQWRVRQVNLSFTYRFNKKKNEREKSRTGQQDGNDGGGDFPG